MADKFGALEIPVSSTAEPVGDPALFYVGDYLKTMLNAKAQTAFTAAEIGAADVPVVRKVFYVNPNGYVLDECELPALFVYRPSGLIANRAADYYEDVSLIHVTWMLPHDTCSELDPRRIFFNTIVKIVSKYVRQVLDPLWAYDGDTTPRAASVAADTDSIVLSAATQTSSQVLSGAGLTGARAGIVQNPRLAPTVTTSVTVADCYDISTPITWTFIDWYDRTRTLTKQLTLVRGGETLTVQEDVKRIISISIPAQTTALGFFQFGTAACEGVGSNLLTAAGFDSLQVGPWRHLNVRVEELNGDGTGLGRIATFEAVEIDLLAQETEEPDLTLPPYEAMGTSDLDTMNSDELRAARTLP